MAHRKLIKTGPGRFTVEPKSMKAVPIMTCRHGVIKSTPALCGRCKYPELDIVARNIAADVINAINKKTGPVKSEMPYKAQCTLEFLIQYLEASV